MRKSSRRYIPLLLIILLLMSVAPAYALFPKSDTLFGVTMPDIAFAVGREADQVETVPEGERVVYTSFRPADYEAFGKYAKAAGLTLKKQSFQDGMLSVELEKDGSSITFRYNYDEKKASLLYPSGVRKEDQKNSAKLSDSLLPEVNKAFGAVIPSIQSVLKNHPAEKTLKTNGKDEIRYSEITISDYNAINTYLTEIGCSVIDSGTKDNVLLANLKLNGKTFSCRYDMANQTFSFICPELYYVNNELPKTVKAEQPILPSIENAFGVVLPRISTAIFRYPDKKETLEDGSYRETYEHFTENEYNAFSAYLLKTHCSVGTYYVDNMGALVIPLSLQGKQFVFTFDQIHQLGISLYPGGAVIEPEIPHSALPTPVPTAAPAPTATPVAPTATPSSYYSESMVWSGVENYFRNSIKWNNPDSLKIYSHTATEDENSYTFMIDYSAENRFGGPVRKTYLIKVNKFDLTIMLEGEL